MSERRLQQGYRGPKKTYICKLRRHRTSTGDGAAAAAAAAVRRVASSGSDAASMSTAEMDAVNPTLPDTLLSMFALLNDDEKLIDGPFANAELDHTVAAPERCRHDACRTDGDKTRLTDADLSHVEEEPECDDGGAAECSKTEPCGMSFGTGTGHDDLRRDREVITPNERQPWADGDGFTFSTWSSADVHSHCLTELRNDAGSDCSRDYRILNATRNQSGEHYVDAFANVDTRMDSARSVHCAVGDVAKQYAYRVPGGGESTDGRVQPGDGRSSHDNMPQMVTASPYQSNHTSADSVTVPDGSWTGDRLSAWSSSCGFVSSSTAPPFDRSLDGRQRTLSHESAPSNCAFVDQKPVPAQQTIGISSSTGMRVVERAARVDAPHSDGEPPITVSSSTNTNAKVPKWKTADDVFTCQVCNDVAAGFHCGAYVCEACKKFFVRCLKQDVLAKFVCPRQRRCEVTKETRTQCQYCRYQKCLHIGMYKPGGVNVSAEINHIPCSVCTAPSSGYHFGAITCEGCKGFFRRTVRERDSLKYQCSYVMRCAITLATRNTCKSCRYQKCLAAGMKSDGSRIGRQPNAVKHATLMQLKRLKCVQHRDHFEPVEPKIEPDLAPAPCQREPASARPGGEGGRGSGSPTVAVWEGNREHDAGMREELVVRSAPEGMREGLVVRSASEGMREELVVRSASEGMREGLVVRSAPEGMASLTPEAIIGVLEEATPILKSLQTRNPVEYFDDTICPVDLWASMLRVFQHTVKVALKFAKKIPGFRQFAMKTQIMMMQNSMYPIVLLQLSMTYDVETRRYNYFNYTQAEERHILATFPVFNRLIATFHNLGFAVRSLGLDDVEATFLSAIFMFMHCNETTIYQEMLVEALELYCMNKEGGWKGRSSLILARLGELTKANLIHSQTMLEIVTSPEKHHNVGFSQLFQETFLNL